MAVTCQGDEVWICQPDGQAELVRACGTGTVCKGGTCVVASVSLARADEWLVLPDTEDPFWADRSDEAEPCVEFWTQINDSAPVIEGEWFEIQTGACNYISIAQPIEADVPAGSTLVFQLHHYALIAGDGPYTVSAMLGDEAVWTWQTEPVPLTQTWIEQTATVTGDWPAGSRLVLNVANHGLNEWAVYDVLVRP